MWSAGLPSSASRPSPRPCRAAARRNRPQLELRALNLDQLALAEHRRGWCGHSPRGSTSCRCVRASRRSMPSGRAGTAAGALAARHAPGCRRRQRAQAAVPRAPGLPVAVRRGGHESPHPRPLPGLSRRAAVARVGRRLRRPAGAGVASLDRIAHDITGGGHAPRASQTDPTMGLAPRHNAGWRALSKPIADA